VCKDQSCLPFEGGGLGIRDLKEINIAFSSKWLWCFGEEPNSLWRRVIAAKYKDHDRGWYSIYRQPVGLYGRDYERISAVRKRTLSSNGCNIGWGNLIAYAFGLQIGERAHEEGEWAACMGSSSTKRSKQLGSSSHIELIVKAG